MRRAGGVLVVTVLVSAAVGSCAPPLERSPPPPQYVPPIADADVCREAPKYVDDPWVRDWERAELADRMRARGCPP